jgi:hypothetical protein
MRQRGFFLITAAILVLAATLVAAPAQTGDANGNLSYARIVRLSVANGDVQIVRPDQSSKWEAAFANMPIQQGFTLGTNNGAAEIEFEQGSTMWLANDSVLEFTELALSDGGRITKLNLVRGSATFNAKLAAADTFSVSTPHFEITPPAKAVFRVDVFGQGGSVSVFQGKVSVESGSGPKDVMKGETFSLDSNAPDLASVKPNPAEDTWDRWVSSRESILASGQNQSLQYTNAPFTYGMADLASYGGWNFMPGCGYGWQPYGMSAGWMPFMDGTWMYYPSFGWSWVSYEPWGWVPYHFGGWTNCNGFGWAWMPGGYGFWSPGMVNWFGVGGGRVGWIPLPPRHPVRVNPVTLEKSVIVSTKNLGKDGRNEILFPAKIGNKLEARSAPPLSNGKFTGLGSAPGRMAVVPTASNLGTLRASLVAAPLALDVIHSATTPRLKLVNSARPAPKVPHSTPPQRTYTYAQGTRSQPGFHPSSSSLQSPHTMSSSSASASISHSSASAATVSGGKH